MKNYVYRNTNSKKDTKLQELLFKKGYTWGNKSTKVSYIDEDYIVVKVKGSRLYFGRDNFKNYNEVKLIPKSKLAERLYKTNIAENSDYILVEI